MLRTRAQVGVPQVCVLLVENNGAFLQAATDFLERYPDLAVVSTPYGDGSALTLATDLQPQIIILDLDVPNLAGLEALRQLRMLLPGTSIIALTSLPGQVPVEAARTAGAHEVVRKTSVTTDLLPAIRRANGTPRTGTDDVR